MTLHYWDAYWGLRLAECPCDSHFVAWLKATDQRGRTIYHFGSGGHHLVGMEAARDGLDNVVLSITASPQEYDDYTKMLIDNPEVSKRYVCYFGDIYTVNARLLPRLDIVTLFHLCEFRSEQNDAYGGLTDREVAQELFRAMPTGGHVLFYTGSFAWEAARPVVGDLVADGLIAPAGRYDSLEIYTRTDRPV